METRKLKVFIQNEADSFVKHIHNEKTFVLKGTVRISRAYPFPYGFILDTTAADGLNVDCFVLTRKRLRTGQVVDCDAIGLMEQIEDGTEDHNVLAVIPGEDQQLNGEWMQTLTDFVNHVFDHVEGKLIHAGYFRGREAALEHVARREDFSAV